MHLPLFRLMFAPLNVNSTLEINGTHLVADANKIINANTVAKCERAPKGWQQMAGLPC